MGSSPMVTFGNYNWGKYDSLDFTHFGILPMYSSFDGIGSKMITNWWDNNGHSLF
jgi:hypothetical protein